MSQHDTESSATLFIQTHPHIKDFVETRQGNVSTFRFRALNTHTQSWVKFGLTSRMDKQKERDLTYSLIASSIENGLPWKTRALFLVNKTEQK